jgi:hypothetical protein
MAKKHNHWTNVEYQMERFGLSKEDAIKKIADIQKNKPKPNPYSIEYQMQKFGLSGDIAIEKINLLKSKTATAKLTTDPLWQMQRFGLTYEDAVDKIKKSYTARGEKFSSTIKDNPSVMFNTVEYWMSKGCSIQEAEDKRIAHIKKMQKVFQDKNRNNPELYKDRTTTQIGYWVKNGYTEIEAKEMQKERQRTFTLEKCIDKYGSDLGPEVWKERHIKWSKKIEEKYKNGEFTKICKTIYSSVELELIKSIVDQLEPSTTYYCALNGQKQYFRFFPEVQKCFAYDFVIDKKIIEFNGDYWHCNPSTYESTYFHKMIQKTAKEIWDAHTEKICLIEKCGYQVLVVWENDYRNNPEKVISDCVNFINKTN